MEAEAAIASLLHEIADEEGGILEPPESPPYALPHHLATHRTLIREGTRAFSIDGPQDHAPCRSDRVSWRLLTTTAFGLGAVLAFLGLRGVQTRAWGVFPRAGQHLDPSGMWEADACERCPVGSCYRGGDGACKLFEGGYYCYVSDCSLVPEGLDFSGCWHWQGEPHYTVSDPKAACRLIAADGTNASNSSSEAEENATTGERSSHQFGWHFKERGRRGNGTAGQRAGKREVQGGKGSQKAEKEALRKMFDDVMDEESHGADGQPAVGSSGGSGAGDGASGIEALPTPAPASSLAALDPSEPDFDPRLSAYWDAFACGPAGDDHNSEWCGGLVKQAKCPEEVEVDDKICYTGKARLVRVLGGTGNGIPQVYNGCLFFYHAQYTCLPSTTTTTSTTTSTTTTTSTVTFTTTTTSTTTSSTETLTTTTTTTTTSTGPCNSKFVLPQPPLHATDLNGIHLPNTCFQGAGPHHVFVIGDWGGLMGEHGPKPARQRPKKTLVEGVDDHPQQRVAEQMRIRAASLPPDYILNVGDNFYWAGIEAACGSPAYTIIPTGQFKWNFEKVYTGPGLEEKPWLGVLGNHDYGGFQFTKGWDQQISYSWSPSGRWVMPAQYWRSTVRYPDFSVDYFFVDTNVFDSEDPHADPEHNICSLIHNPPDATCGAEGPVNVWDCPAWFQRLWAAQKLWLEEGLSGSIADWQVIVTHFPPVWAQGFWTDLADRHGIDLIVTGHMHRQVINNDPSGFLYPTAWIVSGGGGGITSEDIPSPDGNDDQYGFFDLAFTKEAIEIQGITHGGQHRGFSRVLPRQRASYRLRPHSATPASSSNASREGEESDAPSMEFKKL